MDERSKKYLDNLRSCIGFIRMNVGWSSVKDILEKNDVKYTVHNKEYVVCVNGGLSRYNCTVYQYRHNKQDYTAVEFIEVCPPDDYVIVSYIFSCRPSANDVLTASVVDELMSYFKAGFIESTFECWECGRTTHWLDIVVVGESSNLLMRRYEQLLNKYCGC